MMYGLVYVTIMLSTMEPSMLTGVMVYDNQEKCYEQIKYNKNNTKSKKAVTRLNQRDELFLAEEFDDRIVYTSCRQLIKL